LRFADPVYTDAIHLKRTLDASGFKVGCVLSSKMAQMFEHQKGAALFRTEQGDFEALFMTEPYSFDGLVITEKREDKYYEYRFSGTPRTRFGPMQGRRQFFVKHGAILFNVMEDEALADKLKALRFDSSAALTSPRPVARTGSSAHPLCP
jgi:hypothetical protein